MTGWLARAARLAAFLLVPLTASANEPRYAHFIDNACLATNIERDRMAANMAVMNVRELPREQAANIPAERAWLVSDSGAVVVVGFRARTVDGRALRDCVLGFTTGNHAAAMRVIEVSYRLRRALDETQGTQRVTAYLGDLVGLPDAMITIQSSISGGAYFMVVTQGAGRPR